MVDQVVEYLNGKGHRVLRARCVGLSKGDDSELVEYGLANHLAILTFDPDLRDSAMRGGCQCVYFRPRESTARRRVAACYKDIVRLLSVGCKLVTVDGMGNATETLRVRRPRQT